MQNINPDEEEICIDVDGHQGEEETPEKTDKSTKRPLDTGEVEILDKDTSKNTTKKAKKGKEDDKEEKMFADLSSAMVSVKEALSDTSRHAEVTDCHEMWGKILSGKLCEMPRMMAEKFKLKIDTMAMEVLEELNKEK